MDTPYPCLQTSDFLRISRFPTALRIESRQTFCLWIKKVNIYTVHYNLKQDLSCERNMEKEFIGNGLIYEGRSSTEAKLLDAGMISHIILEPFISVDFSSTSTFQLSSSGPLLEGLSTTQDTVSIIFRGIQGVKSTILCRCRGFLECAVRTRLLDFQASLG